MWSLLLAPENTVFGVALMLMLLVGVLETVSLLAGGLTDWVDGLLPDSLTADAEWALDAAEAGATVRFLSWLYVGRVPLLMWIVVFLAVFSACGYVLQAAVSAAAGGYLNAYLAVPSAWLLSLPVVRAAAGGLYRVLPKDETTAVAQESLVGRVGVVVLGEARRGSPAQVRVRDGFGQQHYVMAAPDEDGVVLKQGETVLLVACSGNTFAAIPNPSGSLVD